MRSFSSLSDRELLALAISLEDDSARIYADYIDGLAEPHPAEAERLARVRAEDSGQSERLRSVYHACFGDHVPLVRRQDVKGLVQHRPVWLRRPLDPAAARAQAEVMAFENERVYAAAAKQATQARVRQIFSELAGEERAHGEQVLTPDTIDVKQERAAASHRLFLLQVIQPGLAGLMDGSVFTLAPLFAAALATQSSASTFLVGLAASLGAGISTGFAEALSDDGGLTGRERPWVRGGICGAMTALGGLGHTLPFLLSDVKTAIFLAGCVVLLELAAMSKIRQRFMDTPIGPALLQVVGGGLLVFLTGVVIGSS
jgi:rubrerythrin